ncbi:hypothetical protein [Acinetobacter baumannii]|uniref:hypothetical protein n=1 Tax=Acinetobacter baumannii TaxID=470 RepID=UPI00234260BB|nr:hypothetical protein [Acinetobacter baumannii]MDC4147575.1 hypothetical protein [Acinetobacter baumannii]
MGVVSLAGRPDVLGSLGWGFAIYAFIIALAVIFFVSEINSWIEKIYAFIPIYMIFLGTFIFIKAFFMFTFQ